MAYSLSSLDLYLIKPSKYDDDGYVIRYWKGVLPSNTLACLNGLSEDLRRRGVFGEKVKFSIHNIDETVQRVDFSKIIRSSRNKQGKTIVCLVGVQTNQFPRAADIALTLRKAGIDVLIGGFHVSGVMAMSPELSPELLELRNAGVTLVAGEVEGRWEMILKDAAAGRLKPVYDFLKNPPDLQSAPMPVLPKNLLGAYVVRRFATLDCGRGCPFGCSFCTVINVQGRVMRFRRVECILEMIRKNYLQHKVDFYFFTDDNFSRNRNWRSIFEGLIRLRREENIKVTFMMQVDTQSHKIPEFIRMASAAGCSQVFIGVESLNEKNLEAASKKQNKVNDFQFMLSQYREREIGAHLAYIIGFPFDSTESVAEDVRRLRELHAPQASFFMLTPLPGSMDHKAGQSRNMFMDSDLNNFDTFHSTFRHERMPGLSWKKAYDDAWKSFYGVPNMIEILKRVPAKEYWHVFMNFIWYKNAVQVEQGHPMTHGFLRLKTRKERRRTFPLESPLSFLARRIRDLGSVLKGWVRLAFEMEEAWLATRSRSLLEKHVVAELSGCQKRLDDWWKLRPSQLQGFYRAALRSLESMDFKIGFPGMKVPSSFELWVKRWDFFSEQLTFTRSPMKRYWQDALKKLKGRKLFRIHFWQFVLTSFRELVLMGRFLTTLSREIKR